MSVDASSTAEPVRVLRPAEDAKATPRESTRAGLLGLPRLPGHPAYHTAANIITGSENNADRSSDFGRRLSLGSRHQDSPVPTQQRPVFAGSLLRSWFPFPGSESLGLSLSQGEPFGAQLLIHGTSSCTALPRAVTGQTARTGGPFPGTLWEPWGDETSGPAQPARGV